MQPINYTTRCNLSLTLASILSLRDTNPSHDLPTRLTADVAMLLTSSAPRMQQPIHAQQANMTNMASKANVTRNRSAFVYTGITTCPLVVVSCCNSGIPNIPCRISPPTFRPVSPIKFCATKVPLPTEFPSSSSVLSVLRCEPPSPSKPDASSISRSSENIHH